ncbi:DUF6879 family protein [Streptomyces noboritoensis]|uniref:DUF6879 family protein n=1 Tax=Streptomyces noboritoensis TaxID=67337 RepID=A0ABV6THW2_9ACTN
MNAAGTPARAVGSTTLVRMHVDESDTTIGVEVSSDPSQVGEACRAREAAWPLAAPAAVVWPRVRSSV